MLREKYSAPEHYILYVALHSVKLSKTMQDLIFDITIATNPFYRDIVNVNYDFPNKKYLFSRI